MTGFHNWLLFGFQNWAAYGVAGVLSGLVYLGGREAWERMKPTPPADYTLTITDPDGIPVRQLKMTARGVGRIITDLNNAPKYFE